MKQLFLMVNDGTMTLLETPAPIAKENYVIVETLYSVISAGTERGLASFGRKNLVQKAMERPDQVKKVLEKMSTDGILSTVDSAFNKLREPMPIGYSGVGKIKALGKGVTSFEVGDIVAMAGQAYHSEVNRVNKNLIVKIPKEYKDIRQAALVALGAIALQGIHQAKVEPGETVAVIGLGLLGHITARILDAYGCDVIGFDVSDKTLLKTNLKEFILSQDGNAEEKVKSLTKGRGVDKVIITAATDSNAPMDLAAAISRDRGIICMVGVTNMNLDRRPYFEKELTFTIARSYGPGRYESSYEDKGIDYPIGYVRFTEGRNLEEFIRLLTESRVDFSDVITHEIDFFESEKAYEIITTNKNSEKYIGILLKYKKNSSKFKSKIGEVVSKKTIKGDKISVGLIGAGNFARNTMLPIMKKTKLYHFCGLATTGGINSPQTNKMFKFDYSTNNYMDLINDENIDLIVISTQHNTHAKFIIDALKADKSVYCEKPMCLSSVELIQIKKAYKDSKGRLFIGLNRRYAPIIKKIKNDLLTEKIPAVYNYIANVGHIPDNHWVHDVNAGGGRIIGEAIHFIDTIQYLDGSKIQKLSIQFAKNEAYPKNDNVVITLKFGSGAIANIIYTSMGSKKYPKEVMQIFSNGKTIEMINYIKIKKFGALNIGKIKLRQDKGILNEYKYIYNNLNSGLKDDLINIIFDEHEILIKEIEKLGESNGE